MSPFRVGRRSSCGVGLVPSGPPCAPGRVGSGGGRPLWVLVGNVRAFRTSIPLTCPRKWSCSPSVSCPCWGLPCRILSCSTRRSIASRPSVWANRVLRSSISALNCRALGEWLGEGSWAGGPWLVWSAHTWDPGERSATGGIRGDVWSSSTLSSSLRVLAPVPC